MPELTPEALNMIPADMIDAWLVFWVGSGRAREKCSDLHSWLGVGFTPWSSWGRQATILTKQQLQNNYLVKILLGLSATATEGSHSPVHLPPSHENTMAEVDLATRRCSTQVWGSEQCSPLTRAEKGFSCPGMRKITPKLLMHLPLGINSSLYWSDGDIFGFFTVHYIYCPCNPTK